MVVRKALGIGVVSEAALFVLGLANVVIVSRLLRPDEIGVFSVAVSVLGLAHIFREFGVGQYLVQATEVGRMQFRAAFTVALGSSWVIALILYLIRQPMAAWYGHTGIAEILALLALNFVIMPFGTPQLSMMRRDLQFDKLAWSSLFSSLIQTTVTIAAAWGGESYRSMAWGSIAAHACTMVLLNFMRPGETFVLPTTVGLREVLKFGSVASFASVASKLGGSAPDLIFGRTLGFVEVAVYSRGVGLQRMLVDRINELVRSVHFPTFASNVRAGGDAAALYASTVSYLVAVTAPVLAVLAVLSEPLILFVFGAQWQRSVPVASVVCAACIITSPYSLYGLSLTAAGKVRHLMWSEVAIQSARVAVLASSIWLPLERVLPLLVLGYLAEAVVSQVALRHAFGLRFGQLIRQTWRSFCLVPFAVAGPLAVVATARTSNHVDGWRLIILVAGSALAALGWLAGVWLTNHAMKSEILGLVRRARQLLAGPATSG